MNLETQTTPEERKIMSKYFIDWLIHDVMNGVDHEDILGMAIDKKTGKPIPSQIYYKGKKLENADAADLIRDAHTIKETRLWKYLMNDMNYHAFQLMRKAKTEDDMFVAKTLMYWTDTAKKVINKFIG